MKIVYRGLKEIKADNVAGTGLTWTRAQVHEVEDPVKAAKLLEHPLIWADADGKYELVKAPEVVPPEPRVSIIPLESTSPYWEPVVITVPPDVFERLQKKEIVAVFATPDDADAFADWKLDRDTKPEAPKNTGPKPQDKETKLGLDSAKKKAA